MAFALRGTPRHDSLSASNTSAARVNSAPDIGELFDIFSSEPDLFGLKGRSRSSEFRHARKETTREMATRRTPVGFRKT